MTPEELIAWRQSMGWTQTHAGKQLGVTLRTYQYLESHTTSSGRRRDAVPRYIELAAHELMRKEHS